MATGNEFEHSDKGIGKGQEHAAENKMTAETQERVSAQGDDAAKATAYNACGHDNKSWMSMGEVEKKTAEFIKETPHKIAEKLAENGIKVEALTTYMAAIETKIKATFTAAKVQEDFERANRTA